MLTFEPLAIRIADPTYKSFADCFRAKIPGGWLVGNPNADSGLTFVPDPEHKWDGNSLR